MSDYKSWTSLGTSAASFDSMLRRFGIVTVMNAKVYDFQKVAELFGTDGLSKHKAREILQEIADQLTPICTLDTLKTANVSEEGPTKTITGGQFSNPLIKFGKTATLEMQDALGNADALEALSGGFVEHYVNPYTAGTTEKPNTENKDTHSPEGDNDVLHFGSDFAGPKTIVGESFFIDQKTGQQVQVSIIFYQFLPDSIFNLTQDAEGDASVFDMNGSLLMTEIAVGTDAEDANDISHGVFYSILPRVKATKTANS